MTGSPSRARARVLSVLAVLGVLSWLVATPPGHADPAARPAPAATAASPGPAATVELTGVTPYLAPDGSLTLSGTVTNTGSVPLYTVQVLVTRLTTPATTRAGVDEMVAWQPTDRYAERLTADGTFVNLTSPGEAFAPGATASFSVTASAAQLGFQRPGVYWAGVDVRASVDGSARYATHGRARTVVPVVDAAGPRSPVTKVVWLTSKPSLVRPATTDGDTTTPALLRDDHLAGELTGRLLDLVRAAAADDVSYAIDPALLREVTAMAEGYRVQDAGGTVTGTGQQAAAAWLRLFEALPTDRGYRLPYGNPDLALGAAQGDAALLARATDAAAAVPVVSGLPLLVRSPDGAADERFLAYVAALEPTAVLARTTSGRAAMGSPAGTVVSLRPAATRPDGTAVVRHQRELAVSYAAALDGAGMAEVVDETVEASAELLPWQRTARLADLEASGQWEPSQGTGEPRGRLTAATTRVVADLAVSLARYGDITAAPDVAARLADRTLAPVYSMDWSGDAEATAYALDATGAYATGSDAVRLRVAKKVTMTSRENQFPVTLTNTLAAPAVVQVRFRSSNAGRLSVPDTDPVVVPAGQSVTVVVSPEATVNGEVDMVAQLVTSTGAEIGPAEKFVIEATEAGRVAWVVVIASGAVLVIATVLRIRQVARTGRGAA